MSRRSRETRIGAAATGTGRGLRIDAGKFTTYLGYEVIEGYDGYNDNHSHSFLFGYAQPITHTGLRVSYPFSGAVSAQAYLVNGWDNAVDNNTGQSVGAQLALTPSSRASVFLNGLGGPEQTSESSNLRHAFDIVATFKAAPARHRSGRPAARLVEPGRVREGRRHLRPQATTLSLNGIFDF